MKTPKPIKMAKSDLSDLSNEELIGYQQQLTRDRIHIKEEAERVQAEMDERHSAMILRHAEERQALGQQTRPPTQVL